jgi:tripartite-type tricarboxylate transporter receptor subunit TctC
VLDGYTLLFVPSFHATPTELCPNMGWDPVRDFWPIALSAGAPYVLVVHPALPIRTNSDLIAQACQKPGSLAVAFAYTGIGAVQHLGGKLLKRVAGIAIRHMPLER